GLGFEAANLCVFDDATDTYTVAQPRGLPETYATGPQPASRGMPALVRQRRSLVTLENYSGHELAVPDLVALGIRTAVAALTGVGNRRHAVGLLDSLQAGDAVVLIDLDNFKDVNDTDGHAAGDAVLVALAHHLRSCVRDADLIARYGGEEFVVVLREAGTHALHTTERLLEEWRRGRPRTTYSAG